MGPQFSNLYLIYLSHRLHNCRQLKRYMYIDACETLNVCVLRIFGDSQSTFSTRISSLFTVYEGYNLGMKNQMCMVDKSRF